MKSKKKRKPARRRRTAAPRRRRKGKMPAALRAYWAKRRRPKLVDVGQVDDAE